MKEISLVEFRVNLPVGTNVESTIVYFKAAEASKAAEAALYRFQAQRGSVRENRFILKQGKFKMEVSLESGAVSHLQYEVGSKAWEIAPDTFMLRGEADPQFDVGFMVYRILRERA